MDYSPHATESLFAIESELGNVPSGLMPSDDQYFLLYFIMGTFFGPDLRGEKQPKSVLQRFSEGLHSYTYEQLAGSHIKTVEVERIYYYILRKADGSVVVKHSLFYQFLHGNLPVQSKFPISTYPQFPDLFSPQLHPHSRFKNRYKIIENIVFVNNPETYYMKPEDIERFKQLTGLEAFHLDRDSARLHGAVNSEVLYNIEEFLRDEDNSENVCVMKPVTSVPYNSTPTTNSCTAQLPGTPATNSCTTQLPAEIDMRTIERLEPGMVFLPSQPTKEEWENIASVMRNGSALTGTAAMAQIGPVIGRLDIGESEDSYLFRVSLPGVKRDEREFSCEVENDGKVLIRGVTTTGQRTISMWSEVFKMQSHNLCPPGHFSISFKLPGPVNPQQFSGNFGTDGILEGIVMKELKKKD
ncbi:hypothetical protein NMG60_11020721 [Bertholletia excelsa]